ncbi:Hypothetical protein Pan216_02170 [Planctomycetes bacterium Pan216]|uniref:Ribonuclease n=1 Tax=Kolteria novifilia TaxID=2527975 RepID=A0A518AXD8_9BACT|nr:Hypothetical protein Pan216_02170 [Planctomycetes bacterium Pan216]
MIGDQTQSSKPTSSSLVVGIDEAGYGPTLGPLCVAATAFRAPERTLGDDWWSLLAEGLSRKPTKEGHLLVDDSKRILTRPGGRQALARTVHSFLGLANSDQPRGGLRELLASLAPEAIDSLDAEHWYRSEHVEGHATGSPLIDDADVARLSTTLAPREVAYVDARARVLFPPDFNRSLERLPTKADLNLELVESLLAWALELPHEGVGMMVTVDRLGGRRYYRELLERVAGEVFPTTLEEGPSRSHYRFMHEGRAVDVVFRVKADGASLPVALASMIAKYLRERAMESFNEFWREQSPALKPTAGYPQDARRFLAEIEPTLAKLGIPLEALRRQR